MTVMLFRAIRGVGIRLADTRRVGIDIGRTAERRIPEAIGAASEGHLLALRQRVEAAL